MKLGMKVGHGLGLIVLDGDSAPLPIGAQSPISTHVFWPNVWMDQGATWYGGNGPGHTVLDGDPTPQFLAHVCCGHTAEWINRPLGTVVDLGLGHTVLDGDPDTAPLTGRGTAAPSSFLAHVYCGQTVAHLS